MELRKQIEKDRYNKVVRKTIEDHKNFDWRYGSQKTDLIWRSQISLAESKIKEIIDEKRESGEAVCFLDYGCGTGIHSIFSAKQEAKVYGVDISEESIKVAKDLAKHNDVDEKTSFLVMDCEELEFPENFFDIVFNCGTLSFLDRKKAYSEIVRVLKPEGYFISVDTLGHNPILNLNRKIKMKKGLKTKWAVDHILKMNDIEIIKQYFKETEIKFFHLVSLIGIPFQRFPGFKFFLKALESIDSIFLRLPFLRKYAFKVVFIFSKPKKNAKEIV